MADNEAFEALLVQIRDEIKHAVDRVLTAEIDYMVMGMSTETLWGGVEVNRQFIQDINEWTLSLGVAIDAEASERALQLFEAKRIGVVTP